MGYKAIFKKQTKLIIKNPTILVSFALFPAVAFLISLFIDFDSMTAGMEYLDGMSYEMVVTIRTMMEGTMPNLTTMMANMFAGMALIPVVAGFIAEDIEKKSLRFLMMAGVKPMPYLLGVGNVVFVAAFFSTIAFAFIGGFYGVNFWIFIGAMMSGVAGSIVLGATIGILAKNQQAASSLAMPAAMLFGVGPMIAQFNDTVANGLRFIYTQQLNVVADYLNGVSADIPLWQSFAIMWANVLVLGVLFAVVYKAKGLKR